MEGKQIGKVVLGSLLGEGGMGKVYKGRQRFLDRDVAVKVIHGDLAAGPWRERFLAEARTVAALKHPGIVAVYDIEDEPDGTLYLIMELIEGESLEKAIRKGGRWSIARTAKLIWQVADALGHVHDKGVVHRDLKPANILIDKDGTPKLTDFGIALLPHSGVKTETGTVLGTPQYLAPEVIRGEKATAAADQYALATIAYRILSGSVPFTGDTPATILYHQLQTLAAPLRPIRDDIPQSLDDVILRALQKDPSARYPTVREFGEAFFAAQADAVPAPQGREITRTLKLGDLQAADLKATAEAPVEAAPAAEAVPSQKIAAVRDETPTTPTRGTSAVGPTTGGGPPSGGLPIRRHGYRLMAGALLAVLLLGLAAGAYLLYLRRQVPADQSLPEPPVAQTQPAQTQPTPPPQPPTPVAAPGAGFEISSIPEGASVYINNRPRGKAPVVVTGLPIGEYVIRFELTGYRSLEHDAAIISADTAAREIEGRLTPLPPEQKPASLNVVSKPAGATILLDGHRVGTTPKIIRDLEPGKHDVDVTLDGYLAWSAHPVLKQGSQSNLTATLKKAPAPPPKPPVAQTGPFALAGDIHFDRKLVSGSQPVVPKGLRGQTRGTVLAKITVGKTGEVEVVDVIQTGGKLLDKVVIDTVMKWKYGVPMRDGVPVSIYFEHKFTFK